MKVKVTVLSCLVGLIFTAMVYDGWAADTNPADNKTTFRIGLVSIRRIFAECKKNDDYKKQAIAEQDKIVAELKKLSKELEAGKAGLQTLKPGSPDYMVMYGKVLENQAMLQAKEEFHKNQLALKDQRWTEQLYKDILKATAEVAEQKALNMVFAKDEAELPAPNASELMLTIRTNKLLYSDGCLDITDEVIARLDSEN